MHPDPDALLMLEFQRGNHASFEILFKKYARLLINFGYRFLGSRTRAEEVAQEVLLKVYLAKESYRSDAKFSTWVYRIATNLCLNELRRHEYQKPPLSLDTTEEELGKESIQRADDNVPLPDQVLESKRLEEAFSQAIEQLPERQRAAFVLNRFHDASYQDVAAILECSESSVKSLIHRATGTLKDRLKDYVTK